MKVAIYKLLNIKVKILEVEGDLYTIKPLEANIMWYSAKVLKDKLKDIVDE